MRWTAFLIASSLACGGSGKPGTVVLKDAGSAGAPPPITLGEIISITGPESSFGISTRNGIQLATDEANLSGGVQGRPLEIHLVDSHGSAEDSARALALLVDRDHVKLILGEIASNNSIAMAVVAQEKQVPMISPSSTNPKVTQGRDYVSRVCFVDPFQGFVMAKFARDNLKLQRVAVLRDPASDYSNGLADVFTRKFTEMGGKVVAQESYGKGDQDFRPQLTTVLASKAEALYVPVYYSEVALIARQAKELGLRVPLLGGDGWDSTRLFEVGGSAIEGGYFSDHYSPEDPSPKSQRFIAAYKRKFGPTPDSLAALGYDAARVAIEALKRARSLDGSDVRDAIAHTKDFPGVTGDITLDGNRNAVKPAVVLQVVAGRAKYVTAVSP
jgi:branched-chain amino acid transport system substrate-binding protein